MIIIFVTFHGSGSELPSNGGGVWRGGLPPPQKKYNAIQVKLFTSPKDTVHNLVSSCAHAPA